MPNNKLQFKADKYSGIHGNVFLFSFIPPLIAMNNARNKYEFPFYAITIDSNKLYGDEWIDFIKYEDVCDNMVDFVKKEGDWYFEKLKKSMTLEAQAFKKYTYKLINKLDKLSDKELVDQYTFFVQRYTNYFGLGAMSFVYEGILSERLADSLLSKHDKAIEQIEDLLSTDYRSFMSDSENLLIKIKGANNKSEQDKLINNYLQNFYFINTGYAYRRAMTREDVLKAAQKAKKQLKSKHNNTIVSLTKNEKAMVDILRQTDAIRDQRKVANLVGAYGLCRFLDQAAKRTKTSLRLCDKIFWFEYKDLIYNNKKIVSKLKKRSKVSMVVDDNDLYYLEYSAVEQKNKDNLELTYLKGTPAAKGKAIGKVNIIFGPKEFSKFKKNEILVTDMTRPDFLPIMKKAKAIVTNEGGLTSHAAIVSRELGIPCVVGTKKATRVFKNNEKIEVDANIGVVKKIK